MQKKIYTIFFVIECYIILPSFMITVFAIQKLWRGGTFCPPPGRAGFQSTPKLIGLKVNLGYGGDRKLDKFSAKDKPPDIRCSGVGMSAYGTF